MIKFEVLCVNNRGGAGAGEKAAAAAAAVVTREPLGTPTLLPALTHAWAAYIYTGIYIGHWSEGKKVGARERE